MSLLEPWAPVLVPNEEEWLEEQALQKMRSACEANDDARVRELYPQPPHDTNTRYFIYSCIEESTPNVALLRYVLENMDGARPEKYATEQFINSVETLELLKEFGHDVSVNGHLILQFFAHSREILDWMLDHGVDIDRTDLRRTDAGHAPAGLKDSSVKVLSCVAATGDIELYDHLIARGADQSRSLGLHSASRCRDGEKSVAMIHHLLDKYHMDLEFDNEILRNHYSCAFDAGTPLESAVCHRNIPAIDALLARGAQPDTAFVTAIGHHFFEGWLPALAPLLDAGADLAKAFDWAVLWGNVEAAKICWERGVDPTNALRKQRKREAKKAAKAKLEAERSDGELTTEDEQLLQADDEARTPRGNGVGAAMEEFLRSISGGERTEEER